MRAWTLVLSVCLAVVVVCAAALGAVLVVLTGVDDDVPGCSP